MYGNYYHRRNEDRPLPLKKQHRVFPVTNLTARTEKNEFNEKCQSIPTKSPAKKRTGSGRSSIVHRSLKEIATRVLNAIRFERRANFRKDGWRHEVHGGVKMWVNQTTGEVSTERPYQLESVKIKPTPVPTTKKSFSIRRRLSWIFFGSFDDSHPNDENDDVDIETEKGSSEIEEIFRMIDEEKKSRFLP